MLEIVLYYRPNGELTITEFRKIAEIDNLEMKAYLKENDKKHSSIYECHSGLITCYRCNYEGSNPWYSVILEYKTGSEDVSELYPEDDAQNKLKEVIENEKENPEINSIYLSGGFCPECGACEFER